MYSIHSAKGKKIGHISDAQDLQTSNKKLQLVYDTILNFGLFLYSVDKSGKTVEVIRILVTKSDGIKFVEALIAHLIYLGFIIKKEAEENLL